MGKIWKFEIAGIPRTKARHRRGRSGSSSGRHAYMPDVTADYERVIAGAAVRAGCLVGAGRCDIEIAVWLPNRRRKDADNVAKVVMDGIVRGGRMVLADDSFAHVRGVRCYHAGFDAANPRVVISIVEVDEVW